MHNIGDQDTNIIFASKRIKAMYWKPKLQLNEAFHQYKEYTLDES